ncbi:MAG TPA: hypothetical protein VJ184_07955 [Chryseolinea sp.]|nr:hypothetical protein [Chryseolinea sp.]
MTANNQPLRFIKITSISIILIILFFSCSEKKDAKRKESFAIESEGLKLKVEVVADSIIIPFGMDFLPDGRLLVTDRAVGHIVIVNTVSRPEIG